MPLAGILPLLAFTPAVLSTATVAKLLVYPIDFFKLRLSVKSADETVSTILAKTISEHGVFGVYLGLGPRLVRTFVQKVLYFFLYELLLRFYRATLPVGVTVSVGMNLIIGFFADTLCMPAVVPLELLSMRQAEGEPMSEVISKIYKKSGLTGFLQGWTGYIYGGIMPAIQFTAFDQLKSLYIRRVLVRFSPSFWSNCSSIFGRPFSPPARPDFFERLLVAYRAMARPSSPSWRASSSAPSRARSQTLLATASVCPRTSNR